MKYMKKLIVCGCSWAEGIEVLPPGTNLEYGIKNNPNYFPENTDYRLYHKYSAQLARHFGAEIVDLAKGGDSNSTIIRKLLDYLSEDGYFHGRDTSDIFVSIGWSNPQREEFYNKSKLQYDACNDIHSVLLSLHTDADPYQGINQLFIEFFENSVHPESYINRWAQYNFLLYSILRSYNIPFLIHQNFYESPAHCGQIHMWDDENYWNEHYTWLTSGSKAMLCSLENKNVMLKNFKGWFKSCGQYIREYCRDNPMQGEVDPTYKRYLGSDGLYRFNDRPPVPPHELLSFGWAHPNKLGHDIWTKAMIQHIETYFDFTPIDDTLR